MTYEDQQNGNSDGLSTATGAFSDQGRPTQLDVLGV